MILVSTLYDACTLFIPFHILHWNYNNFIHTSKVNKSRGHFSTSNTCSADKETFIPIIMIIKIPDKSWTCSTYFTISLSILLGVILILVKHPYLCSPSGLFHEFSNQVVCTFLITCPICFTCVLHALNFSNTPNICSSFKVRNELHHTHKSTIKLHNKAN